ncbi:MAG: hypothetical protein JNM88_01365 [Chitinophagaceae bacterium]|nr:hypothetical protein [Chitinophagaceae bacterium]
MEKKIVTFNIYRFHLLPLTSNSQQLELFPRRKITAREIREKKNSFFKTELDKLGNSRVTKHPLKLHDKANEIYLFKIAQKKVTKITRNFKTSKIDNEPYSYVIINNDPSIQKIAISDNIEAFSHPDVIKNILKKTFQKDLDKYGLNIEIEQLFDEASFWKYANQYKHLITYLNFQFIKPNLANISSSLPEVFKKFTEDVNSHESNIKIKAPENGTLEGIDKSNKNIKGLVEYASKGAGNIKLKVKKLRKILSTKENPIIVQADEISIEGAPEQVVKIFKSIVE